MAPYSGTLEVETLVFGLMQSLEFLVLSTTSFSLTIPYLQRKAESSLFSKQIFWENYTKG